MTIEELLLCKNMNELAKAYHAGLVEGLSGKSKPKKEVKQNSKQYPWKRRKRR